MTTLQLERSWQLGGQVGSGGFGRVFEVDSEGMGPCVAKLVPKDEGAARELLFVDLSGVRNVVPIIDSGDAGEYWALVMPRADYSLRDRLNAGGIAVEDGISVMQDVIVALEELADQIVHRDLKPENTLWRDGCWCLADFGISRYAEATTAPDTRKYAFTAAYAAPERWRDERATSATDVYSLGVMAYEMFSGARPFDGTRADLREAHLHEAIRVLECVAPTLSALVAECLSKAPGARPSATEISERLAHVSTGRSARARSGLARLQATNLRHVASERDAETRAAEKRSAEARRADLFGSAQRILDGLSTAVYDEIVAAASAAQATARRTSWTIRLNDARLSVSQASRTDRDAWTWEPPAFDVVAHAEIAVNIPATGDYGGRSHSLWYCDAQEEGRYQWYETAFMVTPLVARRVVVNPFALEPGEGAAQALWRGLGSHQVAWPFSPLNGDTLDAFLDRWASWFDQAASGRLVHPRQMPEGSADGSWRT